MLDSMSYPEIVRWTGYYSLEGWPEWRADVRAALICSVLANCNRDEKKRADPFTIDDFMPFKDSRFRSEEEREPIEAEPEDAKVSKDVVTWLFAKAGAIDVLRDEIAAEAEAEEDTDGR